MNLECSNVVFTVAKKQLLTDVSAVINGGLVTALIGPNGAGKSTLLKVLAGELEPEAGDVQINNQSMQSLKIRDLASIRSVMTQGSQIVFEFTVKEVVLFGWLNEQEILWDVFEAVVKSVAIDNLLNQKFNTLSGGEQQRVQFARAVLQLHSSRGGLRGKYMLLDEPTSSLDIANALHLLSVVKRLARDGIGVAVVLHDLNMAARFADRVILLNDGKVIRKGSIEQVFREDVFTDVYGTKIFVERHKLLDRLVVHS